MFKIKKLNILLTNSSLKFSNFFRELEETEERHQMEVKIYKQKVKHLLYEQENHLAGLKAENMLSLKVAREEHQRQEQQHLNDKQRLTDQLYEKDRQYQEMIRDTKATQSEEVERMREHFEERVREMEKRYSTRVSTLRNDLQLRLAHLKQLFWYNILHLRVW